MNPPQPNNVTVAREAMATRFEVVLHGDDPARLRAAAEEALDEVQRVEAMLAWRMPTSPIALINARAASEPVRVNPELFQFLEACARFHAQTAGAFDITIGPLMRAYGFHAEGSAGTDADAIVSAREACGMQHLQLDHDASTVRFNRPGMSLDFGAIGKGYALDFAAEILREAGIEHALIHGGTSSVYALGESPEGGPWKVAVDYPPDEASTETPPPLCVIELSNRALAVSAVWGRVFRVGKDVFGHVIDPRLGAPAQRALLSVWTSGSATEADAVSTALLTEGKDGLAPLVQAFPDATALVLSGKHPSFSVHAHGLDWFSHPAADAAN